MCLSDPPSDCATFIYLMQGKPDSQVVGLRSGGCKSTEPPLLVRALALLVTTGFNLMLRGPTRFFSSLKWDDTHIVTHMAPPPIKGDGTSGLSLHLIILSTGHWLFIASNPRACPASHLWVPFTSMLLPSQLCPLFRECTLHSDSSTVSPLSFVAMCISSSAMTSSNRRGL